MIRITIEKLNGGTGKPKVIATGTIKNNLHDTILTQGKKGSYDFEFKNSVRVVADGEVQDFPRKGKSVWHLIARCLAEAGIK